jgi:hypothetical protein
VKAYRSTLDNYNKMGSKRGLRKYAAKHRHIYGGLVSLLDLKWQNRPQYTSEDFAAVKLEPAVAAFIADDDAAGTYSDAGHQAVDTVASFRAKRLAMEKEEAALSRGIIYLSKAQLEANDEEVKKDLEEELRLWHAKYDQVEACKENDIKGED